MRIGRIILATLSLTIAGGLSAKSIDAVEKSDTENRVQSETYNDLLKDTLVVHFPKAQDAVSPRDMAALSAFAKNTKAKGPIERFLIISWSDQKTPDGDELPKADRRLAKERSMHVADALKAADAPKTEEFQMIEKPAWIARGFQLRATLIRDLKQEELEAKLEKGLEELGGPGTAVVVAKYMNVTVAH